MDLSTIFKSYDIRGTYPDQLTDELAYHVGQAAAQVLGGPTIAVGRDMRVSSENLSVALMRGITDAGIDVIDAGMVSTDTMYYVSGKYQLPVVMITASHNPAKYGGFKFCRSGAEAVSASTGLNDIREFIASGKTLSAEVKGSIEKKDVLAEYGAHLRSLVDTAAMKPLKIVIDAGNGMGGVLAEAALAGLPFAITPLYFQPDGTFPNHPASPIEPENCVDACNKVQEVGADIGIIFDGDADRAFFVDDKGNMVSSSYITAMVAASVLAKEPGAKILYNVVCSKIVPEVIERLGGVPVIERVGHSFIKERMRAENIPFGGEHSGHYYFRNLFFADSGMLTALSVLELLSKDGRKLSEMLAEYAVYSAIPETNATIEDKAAAIAKVREVYTAKGAKVVQDYDGLSLDMGDFWFNVRPSGTEPLLRINLEAKNGVIRDAALQELQDVLKV